MKNGSLKRLQAAADLDEKPDGFRLERAGYFLPLKIVSMAWMIVLSGFALQ